MNNGSYGLIEHAWDYALLLAFYALKVFSTATAMGALLAYFIVAMVFDVWAGQFTASFYFRDVVQMGHVTPGLLGLFMRNIGWFVSAATTGISTVFWAAISRETRGDMSVAAFLRSVFTVSVSTWYGAVGLMAQVIDTFLFDIPGVPMILGGVAPGYHTPPNHFPIEFYAVLGVVILFTVLNDPLLGFVTGYLESKTSAVDKRVRAAVSKASKRSRGFRSTSAKKPVRHVPQTRFASFSGAHRVPGREHGASRSGLTRLQQIEQEIANGMYGQQKQR